MTTPSTEPLAATLDLEHWPGRERRDPPITDRRYLILSSLAAAMRDELDGRYPGRTDLRVLDIGCGQKPYLPLVAHRAASYRGIDYVDGPLVDDVGPAEDLPYDDDSFDLVICTQVIEHVHDPEATVREIHRVLAPGGTALVSTHGVYIYHPDPPGSGQDYWRWTHSGLDRLFRTVAAWDDVVVTPQRNLIACFANVFCWYLDAIAIRFRLGALGRGLMAIVNRVAEWLDDRFPPNIRHPEPGSMSANYLVAASKGRA